MDFSSKVTPVLQEKCNTFNDPTVSSKVVRRDLAAAGYTLEQEFDYLPRRLFLVFSSPNTIQGGSYEFKIKHGNHLNN